MKQGEKVKVKKTTQTLTITGQKIVNDGIIYYQVKERICFIAENKLEKILK